MSRRDEQLSKVSVKTSARPQISSESPRSRAATFLHQQNIFLISDGSAGDEIFSLRLVATRNREAHGNP
jgi:hypothetical protein